MLIGPEMAGKRSEEADDEKDGADDDVKSVKARGHEEGRAIDVAAIVAAEGEGGMGIFIGLDAGKKEAQHNCEGKPPDQALAVVVDERVVRPGDRRTRGQKYERVEQRQMPRIEDLDTGGGPCAAGDLDAGSLNGFVGEEAGIEEGPEPGDEEHDLRG